MTADESSLIAAERRTRHRMAVRVKQFAAVLTTTGYATVAGGGWQPLLDNKPLRLVHALMFCFGVACLAVSIYIAPEGEVDVRH